MATCQREADIQMNTAPKRVFIKVSIPDKKYYQQFPVKNFHIETLVRDKKLA